MATRGFTGHQSRPKLSSRFPPGQHLVDNSPVLTVGPPPRIEPADWTITLKFGPRPVKAWSWTGFIALLRNRMTRDIHCVTPWSKLNTAWEGVTVDEILADAGLSAPSPFALAHCHDGYTTNMPVADLASGKAMVAVKYEGQAQSPHSPATSPRRSAVALLQDLG